MNSVTVTSHSQHTFTFKFYKIQCKFQEISEINVLGYQVAQVAHTQFSPF